MRRVAQGSEVAARKARRVRPAPRYCSGQPHAESSRRGKCSGGVWRRGGRRRSRTTLRDMTCRGSQDTSFLSRSVNTRFQDTLLWLHPCGPTVDWLRRSTVGSGTCEDVASAYEMTVLLEVVYISPVPAVIAVPALAALRLLRYRTSTCRVCSVFASGLTKCL